VTSLRLLPAKLSRNWRLSLTVAAGLARMSSSRSLRVISSAMGGLPPPFLGASLPGGKRLSFGGEPGITLDRGEADAELAGGLGLGGTALLDCLYYLLA
jgi:hypothetical protein